MWKFKSFIGRELVGIEGRTIDIGNLKVHIQGRVAEGGFSSVYLARDVNHPMQHYALKHIICNDDESLELVMKEIWVMKSLKGHPNVVTLHAHTILDGGRIKEALLLMEFSEKSLVNVLDNRGAGYFDEKQVLLIFRDVCNAVYAMHSQSPPIAHRDLKAENILKGADGLWKLCDFGSVSTNHQRFERPEEMGIEEDNIRKHTTPAYRSPEMWDLFRREIVSEKVDIWALGCLLFRICYFKSAFDGESKLQILNGNYHIPELPKYSSSITDLIRSMLQASPDIRPDITQVLFWVNQQLPREMQKPLPNLPADMHVPTAETHDGGTSNAASKSYSVPRRNPPPPPSSKGHVRNPSLSFTTSIEVGGGGGGPLGAFWSTQHAKTANVAEARGQTVFDGESTDQKISDSTRQNMDNHHRREKMSLPKEKNSRMAHGSSFRKVDSGPSKDIERNLFPEDAGHSSRSTQASQPEKKVTTQSEAVNTFVADFDSNKHSSSNNNKSTKEEALQAEVHKLKEQLNRANLEKTDITNKYEKLCAICRSQRQEIQGLNQAISAQTTPDRVDSKNQNPSGISQSANQSQSQKEKIEGTIWELEQGFFTTPNPAAKSWQAFPEEPKPQLSFDANILSSQTINGRQNKWATVSSGPTNWGFDTDTFTAAPASSQISRTATLGNNSQRFGNSRNIDPKQASQPSGWAGF